MVRLYRTYPHSDVRLLNIVFSNDGDNAWLIDFDLATKEGTSYPYNYNTSLHERHPSATPGALRKKEHDCYALSVIMHDNEFPDSLVKQVECGKDHLSEIAKHFSSSYNF